MYKRSFLFIIIVVFLSSLSLAVPQKINYQGKLLDDGIPVNGDKQMIFSIYDALTGGNQLWSSGVQTVTVVNGLFNYVLGEHNPSDFASINWGEVAAYLEITIDGGTLEPREQIISVAYALFAGNATYATSAGDASTLSGYAVGNLAGNIPIIGPDGKLDPSIIPIVGFAPIVDGISPASLEEGYSATSATIVGGYFIDTPSVMFGTYDCIGETFVNSTKIIVPVPTGIPTGIYVVKVTNPDGHTGTLSPGITIVSIPAPPPTVSSINPNSLDEGYPATTVTIIGSNFQGTPSVMIGTYDCIGETFVNSTEIIATLPAGILTGTYDVIVTNPDSQSGIFIDGFSVGWILNETNVNALNGWTWLNGAAWSDAIADGVSWNKGVGDNTSNTGSYIPNTSGSLKSRMEAAVAGRWSEICTSINGRSITTADDGEAGKPYITALAIADCVDGERNIGPTISGNSWESRSNTLDAWARASGHSALPAVKYNGSSNEFETVCSGDFWRNTSPLSPGNNNFSWAAACGWNIADPNLPWTSYARLLGYYSCSTQGCQETSIMSDRLSFRIVVRP